jgi:glyoxylase-like metal-dependent hydrolase (beta-lactamase superfamily II)
VRSDQGDHLLVGDACYHCGVVESRYFPDYSDAAAMNSSLDALLERRGPDTVIVWGRAPARWAEVAVLPRDRSA